MKTRRLLPGFRLSLGVTLLYLSLMVVLPLVALSFHAAGLGWEGFWAAVFSPQAVASYGVTLSHALGAALINLLFGSLLAWVLVRYTFPGKALLDMFIDLPFALPSAVGGIALAAVFANTGWIGGILEPLGIKIAYSEAGITVAMVFVSLPFVVRTLQPVLENLDPATEEAASLLGASKWQTFLKVILPAIFPAALTGFTLALSRGLGEYGTAIFITSNIPLKSEMATRYIYNKLDQYEIPAATAAAVVMLFLSLVLLLGLNALQAFQRRREGRS